MTKLNPYRCGTCDKHENENCNQYQRLVILGTQDGYKDSMEVVVMVSNRLGLACHSNLSRDPDSLTILQKWFDAEDCGGDANNYVAELYGDGYGFTDTVASIAEVMIKQVRENPDAVIKRGKKNDWPGWFE
jgi:hypothetical protein